MVSPGCPHDVLFFLAILYLARSPSIPSGVGPLVKNIGRQAGRQAGRDTTFFTVFGGMALTPGLPAPPAHFVLFSTVVGETPVQACSDPD